LAEVSVIGKPGAAETGLRNSGKGGSPISCNAAEKISTLPEGVAKPPWRYLRWAVSSGTRMPRGSAQCLQIETARL